MTTKADRRVDLGGAGRKKEKKIKKEKESWWGSRTGCQTNILEALISTPLRVYSSYLSACVTTQTGKCGTL